MNKELSDEELDYLIRKFYPLTDEDLLRQLEYAEKTIPDEMLVSSLEEQEKFISRLIKRIEEWNNSNKSSI